jgi:hypothetical protein
MIRNISSKGKLGIEKTQLFTTYYPIRNKDKPDSLLASFPSYNTSIKGGNNT